jgi:hypothetical protein
MATEFEVPSSPFFGANNNRESEPRLESSNRVDLIAQMKTNFQSVDEIQPMNPHGTDAPTGIV